jgi:DNA polymerase I-like protein with 3'-5' exonuclease and polymerase domains
LEEFNTKVPYIRLLATEASDKAKTTGVIRTIGGRALHFPQEATGKYLFTHKGLNRLVQGSAADQMKQAMVDLDRELPEFYMQLQIHDEVDASVPNEQVPQTAAEIMSTCIPSTVPFRVDVELGPSWGELK